MIETTVDFSAVKARQQGAWASGNYAVVGTTLQIVGESLCEALDLRSGSRVLDVAAGNGNATLAAARRYADVTSTDYVPSLLEQGEMRARAEGLPVHFQEADAENLPFEDGSFDVAVSTFGVMFAPDQAKAAAELVRVVRPGGKIGLANWTPESPVGKLFGIVGRYVPPPAGLKPPTRWGTEVGLGELFGKSASSIRSTSKQFVFRYRSSEQFIDVFRSYYGPIHRAFAALDAERRAAFTWDLLDLLERNNRAGDGTLVLPSDYLEVVIDKQK